MGKGSCVLATHRGGDGATDGVHVGVGMADEDAALHLWGKAVDARRCLVCMLRDISNEDRSLVPILLHRGFHRRMLPNQAGTHERSKVHLGVACQGDAVLTRECGQYRRERRRRQTATQVRWFAHTHEGAMKRKNQAMEAQTYEVSGVLKISMR